MPASDNSHQQFGKYEQQGPYHWNQMRRNIKRFNAGLAARYEISTSILNTHCRAAQVRSIVDVGCGDGYFTNVLGQMFPRAMVRGFDFSEKGIEYAHLKASAKNVIFTVGDAFQDRGGILI